MSSDDLGILLDLFVDPLPVRPGVVDLGELSTNQLSRHHF
jgi:hypothetical protein